MNGRQTTRLKFSLSTLFSAATLFGLLSLAFGAGILRANVTAIQARQEQLEELTREVAKLAITNQARLDEMSKESLDKAK